MNLQVGTVSGEFIKYSLLIAQFYKKNCPFFYLKIYLQNVSVDTAFGPFSFGQKASSFILSSFSNRQRLPASLPTVSKEMKFRVSVTPTLVLKLIPCFVSNAAPIILRVFWGGCVCRAVCKMALGFSRQRRHQNTAYVCRNSLHSPLECIWFSEWNQCTSFIGNPCLAWMVPRVEVKASVLHYILNPNALFLSLSFLIHHLN